MGEVNPLTTLIKPYVAEIQRDAKAGNQNAQEIIKWYRLYCKCPEAGALVVCEEAFKAWRRPTVQIV